MSKSETVFISKSIDSAKATLRVLLDEIDPTQPENGALLLKIKEINRIIEYYYAVQRGDIDIEGLTRKRRRK